MLKNLFMLSLVIFNNMHTNIKNINILKFIFVKNMLKSPKILAKIVSRNLRNPN